MIGGETFKTFGSPLTLPVEEDKKKTCIIGPEEIQDE